ncbi:hypothetical protein KUTeg_024796 [Tegillarca granosa]|uniref:CWH43-like N-terminal domain-containing protein n=1 Tax=Tegillarca granosa TaxID=220873 RepID=A0ABQ9DZD7_TEGGR|nr:hypothetical protein KUTeg_024796 [Tegillarca granosa]
MGTKVINGKAEDVLLSINFRRIAIVTVSLPAFSLFYCFVTGIIFRFDEVNETVCKAQNVVPSISAVTGITPQAYVWRICIALHCAPRFAVGFMYYNYYKARMHLVSKKYHGLFLQLLRFNFWFYTIENSCLVGVTYISNKENYPVHEKIFVVFMVMCCCYMLLNTIIYKWTRSETWSDVHSATSQHVNMLLPIPTWHIISAPTTNFRTIQNLQI